MIHYAHDCNFQNIAHLLQLIFEAIFEEGKNVSSVETLVQLAKEAGLEGAEDVLSSNQYIKEVLEDDDFAKNNANNNFILFILILIISNLTWFVNKKKLSTIQHRQL